MNASRKIKIKTIKHRYALAPEYWTYVHLKAMGTIVSKGLDLPTATPTDKFSRAFLYDQPSQKSFFRFIFPPNLGFSSYDETELIAEWSLDLLDADGYGDTLTCGVEFLRCSLKHWCPAFTRYSCRLQLSYRGQQATMDAQGRIGNGFWLVKAPRKARGFEQEGAFVAALAQKYADRIEEEELVKWIMSVRKPGVVAIIKATVRHRWLKPAQDGRVVKDGAVTMEVTKEYNLRDIGDRRAFIGVFVSFAQMANKEVKKEEAEKAREARREEIREEKRKARKAERAARKAKKGGKD